MTMNRKLYIFPILVMMILIITGCNTTETTEAGESNRGEKVENVESVEHDQEVPEEEGDELEEDKEEMAEAEVESETAGEVPTVEKLENDLDHDDNQMKNTIGDYDVFLGGEVVETEDTIQIHGESNLIPGARVVG